MPVLTAPPQVALCGDDAALTQLLAGSVQSASVSHVCVQMEHVHDDCGQSASTSQRSSQFELLSVRGPVGLLHAAHNSNGTMMQARFTDRPRLVLAPTDQSRM